MGFGTSIIIGIVLGIVVGVIPGILGLIPILGALIAICNCLVSPLLAVVGGYLVGSMGKVRAGDWGGLAVQNGIYALTAAIVGTAVNTLLAFFNIGATAIGGNQDIAGLGITAAGGILGIVLVFVIALVLNLVLGFIGGAIYLLMAKK
jgi:hypothetical protein